MTAIYLYSSIGAALIPRTLFHTLSKTEVVKVITAKLIIDQKVSRMDVMVMLPSLVDVLEGLSHRSPKYYVSLNDNISLGIKVLPGIIGLPPAFQ